MRVAVLAVPVLIGGIAVAVLVALSRAHIHLRRLWRDGIEVDGTCLRSYVKHRGVGTNARSIQHHVYEFRTREGQQLRFDEAGGPATVVEGDTVTIRDQDGRPERATAIQPGQRGALVVTVSGVLIALAIITFAAFFIWFFLTYFAA